MVIECEREPKATTGNGKNSFGTIKSEYLPEKKLLGAKFFINNDVIKRVYQFTNLKGQIKQKETKKKKKDTQMQSRLWNIVESRNLTKNHAKHIRYIKGLKVEKRATQTSNNNNDEGKINGRQHQENNKKI